MASARVLGGGSVDLDPVAFEAKFNMPLVHETVRAELNARRHGTASTKTRGEVSGGGAKPWRQKGTGRARAGSSRSPVWTGGGTVFGPTPRHYTVKVNRKARRAALRSVLSLHAERGSLAVFNAAAFSEPSTAQAAELIAEWSATSPTLVVLAESEAAAAKSFRRGRPRQGGLAARVRGGPAVARRARGRLAVRWRQRGIGWRRFRWRFGWRRISGLS